MNVLAIRRLSRIPFPEKIQLTPASVNDLTVFKEGWSDKTYRYFFGAKVYNKQKFLSAFEQEKKSIMLTPIKGVRIMARN